MKASAGKGTSLFIIWVASAVYGQTLEHPSHRVADELGSGYIGGNVIAREVPEGYEKFLVLWVDPPKIEVTPAKTPATFRRSMKERLYPDSQGRIAVRGRVVFKGVAYPNGGSTSDGMYVWYTFKDAFLVDITGQPVGLSFDTETVDGVGYHFEGIYVEDAKGTKHLKGTMTALFHDQKAAVTKLIFSPYYIMQ